jgi:glutamyl-tRNA reductase
MGSQLSHQLEEEVDRPPEQGFLSPPALAAVGLDHRSAPLSLRERLALSPDRVHQALAALRPAAESGEICVLSTCLRTEIYSRGAESDLADLMAALTGVVRSDFEDCLQRWEGPRDVAGRLFRVAAGLESFVLGEAQILRQVKDAYRIASGQESTGPTLSHLFEGALALGRRVRRETGIGAGNVSIPSLAVRMAEERLGPLRGRRAVILGTGKMARIAAKHLAERECHLEILSSRTFHRACELAEEVGGSAIVFAEDLSFCRRADLIVCATFAHHTLLGAAALERAVADREGPPLLLIDLSMPRAVDPEAARVAACRLVNLDDLERAATANRQSRQEAAGQALAVVEEGVEEFVQWWNEREVVPTIRALFDHLERVRLREVARFAGKADGCGESLDHLSRALMAKVAHGPVTRLREEAARGDPSALASLIREMFRLDLADGD